MRVRTWLGRMMLASFAALAAFGQAYGYGADGHRIAGLIAQQHLCAEAEQEVRTLGQGQDLDTLGLWADWIRGEPEWRHTAPWHYMNIPDGARLEDYRHPLEGDILWAISRFAERLADRQLPPAERRDALRFLVHFVVDLHQPLHVGRESDRGGNMIDVDPGIGEPVNLHRFWDAEAVQLTGLPPEEYAHGLSETIAANAGEWEHDTLMDWAHESRELRPDVYDFDSRNNHLTREYRTNAERITRQRLAQAGVRLGAEINRALCSTTDTSH